MKKLLSIVTILSVLTVLTPAPTKAATYSDFTLGSSQAPVKMEVFNDFQCPYCARFHRTLTSGSVQRLIKTGRLQITFKDFPLEFHANANTAARAANAVMNLAPDKYHNYMNFIFRTQSTWGSMSGAMKYFADQAEKKGIDRQAFQSAFDDPQNIQEIKEDIVIGNDLSINGTPSYTLNGELQVGAQPLQSLLRQIKTAQ